MLKEQKRRRHSLRKVLYMVLTLALVVPFLLIQTHQAVQAETAPMLFVNGEPVKTDVSAFIESGRTMVPVRFVADQLGYKVEWNGAKKEVTLSAQNGSTFKMVVGQKTIYDKNGKAIMTMDVAPLIRNQRTMVPAKFVTEVFGGSVDWDPNMKLASVITYPKVSLPQNQLVLGLIPSQEAENLDAKAKPLADALSKELGVPVKSFIGTNYNAVIEAMGAGKVDIGAFGPQSYVIAADKGYAVPAAASVRNGSKTYRAQFVVLKDAPFKKLEDIKGKKIAWVDPTSTSGYTYPSALLREKGIDPERDVQGTFAGGHDKAILALLRGDVDVAVSFDDARTIVQKTDPQVMEKTRILATTADIPNDLIALRAKLPDYWKAKIKEALFKIVMTEDGKTMLKNIYNITDLAPAKDSDYDIVRKVQKMNEGK